MTRANYMSLSTGTTKSQFSCICNFMIFYLQNTKVAVEVLAYQGRLYTKFKGNHMKCFRDSDEWDFFWVFFLFFFRLFARLKNRCNSQTRTPIQLKRGTLVGRSEAIIIINFDEDPYKILRVIIDHLCKTRTIFWHTYRINCWLKISMWLGSTSEGCLLVVRNEWSKR